MKLASSDLEKIQKAWDKRYRKMSKLANTPKAKDAVGGSTWFAEEWEHP